MKNGLRKTFLLFGLICALLGVFRVGPPISTQKETIAFASNISFATSSIQTEISQNQETSAPTCFLGTGVPYRAARSKTIYLITPQCTKYPLLGVNAFYSFFSSYKNVVEVPTGTLNAVPLDLKIKSAGWGPKKVFLNGTIVRDEGAEIYYLLMNKTLYPFASVDVINSFGLRVKSAQDVDPLFINKYSIGRTLNTLSDLPVATVFKYPNSSRLYLLDRDSDGKLIKKYIAVYSLFSRNYSVNQIVRFPNNYVVPYGSQRTISTSKVIRSIIQSSADTSQPQKDLGSNENTGNQNEGNNQDVSVRPPISGDNSLNNQGQNQSGQTISNTSSTTSSSINSIFPRTTSPIGGGTSVNNNGGRQTTVSSAADTVNLSLMVTEASSSVTPSTSISFTIEYRNLGTGTATGVVVREVIPDNTFFYVNSSTGSWDCADRSTAGTVCLATIGSVAPGATSSIIFALTTSSSYEGTFSNTTTIYDSGSLGFDTDTNNNTAYSSAISVNGQPDMSISVSTSNATSSVSTTVLFNLAYSNIGTVDASNVTISATVPSSSIFTSASSTGSWSCTNSGAPRSTCTASIGTVSISGSGSLVFATTPYYSVDGSSVSTTVTIADDGTFGSDSNSSNNSSSLSVHIMRIPLTELGSNLYLNRYSGGLFPGGTNTMPSAHATAGLSKSSLIQQRNSSGTATTTNGVIVMLSIGMTNTNLEFGQFETAVRTTLSGNRNVVVINGASGSEQYVTAWDQTSDTQYSRILSTLLTPRGLAESQVQAVWMKLAISSPTSSLASSTTPDAYTLKATLGHVVRTLKSRYPNLQQVFFSSRSYAGYTSSAVNPEPYAYESGFAVKWLIEAQINQMDTGTVDSQAGNLNYDNGTAPWISWGPYIWANGTTTSTDGVSWSQSDFQSNGLNVSTAGANKIRDELTEFFDNSPYTSWYSASTSLALTDLVSSTYLGYSGGLYPNATNTAPSAHRSAGLQKASEIQPLDVNGNVDTVNGKITLLSIGLSNTLQAFSGFQYLVCGSTNYSATGVTYPTDENGTITPVNCAPQTGSGYNTTTLRLMNGSIGGQVAANWDGTTSASDSNYGSVSSSFFFNPYSARQVQAIWLKLANASPTTSLMTSSTTLIPEAIIYQRQLGNIMRTLKQRYPNLKQVFISPRTYGGYDISGLNTEPYSYEYSYSIKWLIESQINQMQTGVVDRVSGYLDYSTSSAPWIDWGPYIWANGSTTNSDGFNWRYNSDRSLSDVRQDDRVHESLVGRLKVGQKLIDFFMNSEYTSWFRE